jgi:hypothetical protein
MHLNSNASTLQPSCDFCFSLFDSRLLRYDGHKLFLDASSEVT